MNKLKIKLQYCCGIKKLEKEFDFNNGRTFSIYAPNGSMKTSFAETFKALSKGEKVEDRIHPDRDSIAEVQDENFRCLLPEEIFVIEPLNEQFDSDKLSTLIVKKELKEEYEEIYKELDDRKSEFLKKLKTDSKSSDCEEEFVSTFFENEKDDFFDIIDRLYPLFDGTQEIYDFKYNDIFDKKGNVKKFLDKHSEILADYIREYESLLSGSDFFKKSINSFGTYQAGEISKSIKDNSFFEAGHSIKLNNGKEIESSESFNELLGLEIDKIINDENLKKAFKVVDDAIGANTELRKFQKVIENNNLLLVELNDYESFKKKVWLGFLAKMLELVKDLFDLYNLKKQELNKIIEEALDTLTEWEKAVEEFNERFKGLPFKIEIRNKEDAILKKFAPTTRFVFHDLEAEKEVTKEDLLKVLSRGERRALYLLNIIFEVQARKKLGQKTLLVIDDIADSFDYKNKYAIVEYLKDISDDDNFYQIILTHNFDFFRTIHKRNIAPYDKCLISVKNNAEIKLEPAEYLNNPFIIDWKNNLDDNRKLISSIPFVRNIAEYTKGQDDEGYLLLTSILHIKDVTDDLTLQDIKKVFNDNIQGLNFPDENMGKSVLDLIFETAELCLTVDEGINLENKIVLSIAIRLKAEQFMKSKITDAQFLIDLNNMSNQTRKLLEKYEKEFGDKKESIKILKRVNLTTPENIHINSFMYEPILDMGDIELRELYKTVRDKLI